MQKQFLRCETAREVVGINFCVGTAVTGRCASEDAFTCVRFVAFHLPSRTNSDIEIFNVPLRFFLWVFLSEFLHRIDCYYKFRTALLISLSDFRMLFFSLKLMLENISTGWSLRGFMQIRFRYCFISF